MASSHGALPPVTNARGCFGKLKTELKLTLTSPGVVRFDCKNNTRTSVTFDVQGGVLLHGVVYVEEAGGVYPVPPSIFTANEHGGVWEIKDRTNSTFFLKFKVING